MQTHVKVVAVLLIVLSAFGVMLALGLGAIMGIAGMGVAAADPEDAAFALPILAISGTALTVFLLALSLPGLVAGFGLLSFRPWARILAIVICALNLIHIPVGTIFGAYGLWVLLNKDTERLFSGTPPAAVQP